MNEEQLSRRAFVCNTSVTTLGMLAVGLAGSRSADGREVPADTSKILNYHPKMGYRRLGKTGLLISEISLGGHWVDRGGGRLWGTPFPNDEVPDDVARNRTEVVSRCIDRGINYMEAVPYTELAGYRVALKGRREKMYLAASSDTLNPNRQSNCTVSQQSANIDDCLKRLATDYLDVWRPMFRQDGKHVDTEVEASIEAFEKAHRQGKARWLGMSCHNRAFVSRIVEKYPQFSMVIFPYTVNPEKKPAGVTSVRPAEIVEVGTGDGAFSGDVSKSIFEAVQKHDVGVVTIKPFAGGALFRNKITFARLQGTEADYERARLTLAYILCNPCITATIPGMSSIEEVDNNTRATAERLALLNRGGWEKLQAAATQMWADLPDEYRWLRQWKLV
jgi:predicted aldo/keto reductase-like oxidoreductase